MDPGVINRSDYSAIASPSGVSDCLAGNNEITNDNNADARNLSISCSERCKGQRGGVCRWQKARWALLL